MFAYKVSVIVPVYNCEEYIPGCLQSLLAQTLPQSEFEVLLINDGSTDNSAEICRRLAEEHANVRFFDKENGGVSSTRNMGIENAEGKYFLFLDADDTLTPDTLKTVSQFFDKHYDEIDMVTYRIVPFWEDHRYPLHYRYKILQKTGIYDLNEGENRYITQTTMNICVKNLGKGNNVLFDTSLVYHEDQKYCLQVLDRYMKLGFCDGPEYLYLRRPGSATGSRSYAYYLFEDTTALWEELFGMYEGQVPPYLQALYLNDLNWKTSSDILLPYHYKGEQFGRAVERLDALLMRCDDDVIMSHPRMDLYLKLFFLRCKGQHRLSVDTTDGVRVFAAGEEIYQSDVMTVVATRMKVIGDRLMLEGFVKSPAFLFSSVPPRVLLHIGEETREITVEESAFCYYKARVKTAQFWRISLSLDINTTDRFWFEVQTEGKSLRPEFFFMANTCFGQRWPTRSFFLNGKRFTYNKRKSEFRIDRKGLRAGFLAKAWVAFIQSLYYVRIKPTIVVNRAMATRRLKQETWLYLDRDGVFDNAYEQFIHDADKQDGIQRHYILNDCDRDRIEEKFTPEQQKMLVPFGSRRHKYLYLNCDKILTSFSHISNICPFGGPPMRWYYNTTRYELIYLQHGILHASLLNMYAKERCQVDRVVVSSHFEVENFVNKYGYQPSDLIQSGMPRFDFMHPDASGKKKNRILLSPSWRSNLIGKLVDNKRQPIESVFLESDFYREFSALLQSPELAELLEKHDLYLDFKNHPIFACYNHLFTTASDRITVSSGGTVMDDYLLMITDYSSIVFDAVYIGCPIVYFVPDYDKFVAGVSHNYRELDLPLEQGFGPFAQTAEELVKYLEECMANAFVPQEPYRSRMAEFFLHRDGNCRDRLYEALTDKN
ncbi:MAG: glycosyltransferase [Clostridia bacterium]|nr:glycosyltransferase [Clostridia bacterium]